ncbi:MAG: DUF4139 domain-containing protein, partial [Alphaproteobacteria bacterium]|nr:DUF4139 domain-containing protein [Alphaproteobacteria bacterium]
MKAVDMIARLALAAVVAVSLYAAAVPAVQAQSVVVSADQRTDLALTVYQGGFALVHEVRRANLLNDTLTVILPDLSDRLDITTIRLEAGENVQIRSVALDREVLSSGALLRRSVGQRVRVARINPATGVETFEDAEVLAVAPDLVLRIGDRIETALPGRIVFADVPPDLRPAPGIVANVTVPAAGERALSLSYLTDGVSWKASYVGRVAEDGERLELTGWALVDNQTNTAFPAAQLALIAGQVNRATAQPIPRQPVARLVQAEAVADGVSLGATGPYYRYALPQTFDIRARQQTQVELIRSAAVAFVRTLRTQGGPLYSVRPTSAVTQPVTARLTIANETNNGLGIPLPAGVFSSFEEADGREVFQGGAMVTATPVGGEMVVELGQAFDVTFERTVLNFNRTGPRNQNVDTTQKLTLKNGASRPAAVEIIETFRGEWKIVRESAAHTQVSAFQAMWQVTVPANGEASVEYR